MNACGLDRSKMSKLFLDCSSFHWGVYVCTTTRQAGSRADINCSGEKERDADSDFVRHRIQSRLLLTWMNARGPAPTLMQEQNSIMICNLAPGVERMKEMPTLSLSSLEYKLGQARWMHIYCMTQKNWNILDICRVDINGRREKRRDYVLTWIQIQLRRMNAATNMPQQQEEVKLFLDEG